jgi:hypothetical protein
VVSSGVLTAIAVAAGVVGVVVIVIFLVGPRD